MPDPADSFRQVVHYVRLTERLRSSIGAATFLVSTLQDVTDEDLTLAPEITAAIEHVTGAVDALARAERFANTRLEVALGQEENPADPGD